MWVATASTRHRTPDVPRQAAIPCGPDADRRPSWRRSASATTLELSRRSQETVMGDNKPFGFDPDDLDRVIREAGEELQGVKDRIVRFLDQADSQIPWTGVFADFARSPRGAAKPETAGETGDGVWAIYTLDDEGVARVEQVYAT